ncbi:MAG: hypothetical protein HY257_04775, partial [Chloroflexi bacterium]|nr:hypothetical protein [Chloroflexota bacterium]
IQVAPANLTIQHPLPFIPFSEPNAQNELIAQLTGYDLPVRELRAGETVRVTTYWHSVKTRGEIQLVDDANRLVRAAPLELETGKDVRVVSEINAPPDARGEYRVRVQVEATPYDLARIAIEPRAELVRADALRIANAIDYRFGDVIHLIGYDLPQKKITNSQIPITLYWRADRAAEKNFIVFVHLLGKEFNAGHPPGNFLWGQIDRAPQPPINAWRAGEVIVDAYRVPLDARAPIGTYKIEIGLYDPATGARLTLNDGSDSAVIAEVEVGP